MTQSREVRYRVFEVIREVKKGNVEAENVGALSESLNREFGVDVRLARGLAHLAWETRFGAMTDCTVRHVRNLVVEELETATPKKSRKPRAQPSGTAPASAVGAVTVTAQEEVRPSSDLQGAEKVVERPSTLEWAGQYTNEARLLD